NGIRGWGPRKLRRGRRDGEQIGRRRVVTREAVEEREPVAQQTRHEEAPPHRLLAADSALPGCGRVREDLRARVGARGGGGDEPACDAVLDLRDDPPDAA